MILVFTYRLAVIPISRRNEAYSRHVTLYGVLEWSNCGNYCCTQTVKFSIKNQTKQMSAVQGQFPHLTILVPTENLPLNAVHCKNIITNLIK